MIDHAGGEASGYFEVFLKYGQPPGWHYGQWDFRQAYQYYQTEGEKDQEVKFDAQTDGFQTGTPVNAYDFDARGNMANCIYNHGAMYLVAFACCSSRRISCIDVCI